MNDMPLISVIVPVYNVDRYIGECLTSLINQTYTNLEIICVDDGSSDNSGVICDQYAAHDKRIKVFHQKNKGAGAARNFALKHVQGKYIGFIDSDDYIDCKFYEILLSSIQNSGAQIASCDTVHVYKNRNYLPEATGNTIFYSGMDFLKLTAIHWKYYIMVNKLFSCDIIKNAAFPEGNVIDDGFFTYKIIAQANKIAWCNLPLYYYRQRCSSVMNMPEYQKRRDYDAIVLLQEKLDFVKQEYPLAISSFEKKMMDSYFNIICSSNIDEQTSLKCITYMRNNCKTALFKEYKFKESIWWIIFLLFPKVMVNRRKKRMIVKEEDSQDEFFE